MTLNIKSNKVIARGWITSNEMDHVLAWMTKETGSIFESGSANGRLFSYLHHFKPHWKYTALDNWDGKTHLLHDYEKEYGDTDNISTYITHDMFKKNCPFATDIKQDFWEFDTDEKFDVVSIGAVGSSWSYEEWEYILEKSLDMTKPGGITIGRNYSSGKPYAQNIRDIVAKKYVIRSEYVDAILEKYDMHRKYQAIPNDYVVGSSFAFSKK